MPLEMDMQEWHDGLVREFTEEYRV